MPFSIVGLYFGYDEVGAIAPKLQEQLGLTLTDIGWLYRLVGFGDGVGDSKF